MELKSSGKEQQFQTGAVRDVLTDKPRPELISPIFEQRLANWLARGASRYQSRNWELGIPLSRSLGSLRRHLLAWQQQQTDEDHLAAAACNVMFILHTQEMIDRGILPKELDDLPRYGTPSAPTERRASAKPK